MQIDAATYPEAIAIETDAHTMTMGVVEATTTTVRDVNELDPFVVDIAPTFQVLENMEWLPDENKVSIQYESLAGTGSGESDYSRILYLRKRQQSTSTGDSTNPCLSAADAATCWSALEQYATKIPAPELGELPQLQDYLDSDGANAEGVSVDVTRTEGSNRELITIKIDIANIIGSGGAPGTTYYGSSRTVTVGTDSLKYWDIGIGMLFWPTDSAIQKTIIFDHFQLREQSDQTWQVEKINQYTLARHVNFQYSQVESEFQNASGELRVAVMQFVLQQGHTIYEEQAKFALQTECTGDAVAPCFLEIEQQHCDHLGDKMAAMPERSCLSMGLDICNPKVTSMKMTNDAGEEVQQSVLTYLIPVPPEWREGGAGKLLISVALYTCNSEVVGDNAVCVEDASPILSLLNFEADSRPVKTCRGPVTQSFAPIDHVAMQIFGKTHGDTLTALQTCSGADPCVASALWPDAAGEEYRTLSVIQALLLLVVRPADTAAARDFFTFTNDVARLDDLYITHRTDEGGQVSVAPPTRTTDESGRVTLTLDPAVLVDCPLEDDSYNPQPTQNCISTHDYGHAGAIARPVSGGTFVHELQYMGSFVLTQQQIVDGVSFSVANNVAFLVYVDQAYNYMHDGVVVQPSDSVQIAGVQYHRHIIQPFAEEEFSINLKHSTDDSTAIATFTNDASCRQNALTDLAFLERWYNVADAEMRAFYIDSLKQLPDNGHAALYWVLPTYNWPVSVLGLIDRSVLAIGWSVYDTSAAAADSANAAPAAPASQYAQSRRLLAVADQPHSSSAHMVLPTTASVPPMYATPAPTQTPAPADTAVPTATPALKLSQQSTQAQLAKSLQGICEACARIAPSPTPTWLANDNGKTWKQAMLQTMACTHNNSKPKSPLAADACSSVRDCNSTEHCVGAIMHVLHLLDMPSLGAFPQNSTLSTSFQEATLQYLYTPQKYVLNTTSFTAATLPAQTSTLPNTTPQPNAHSVAEQLAKEHEALVGLAGVVYARSDLCAVAQRDAQENKHLHVLAVPYDNSVPPPLALSVHAMDGNITCSLQALVQALPSMRLAAVSPTQAMFVSEALAKHAQISPIDTQRAHTTAMASATKEEWPPSVRHLVKQDSFFMLPRAALEWLHKNKHLYTQHKTSPTTSVSDKLLLRAQLECGGMQYREQISSASPRRRPDKLIGHSHLHRAQARHTPTVPSKRLHWSADAHQWHP